MERRITIDIDTKSPLKIFDSLRNSWYLDPREIILKKSNSKGYHLIIWIDEDKILKWGKENTNLIALNKKELINWTILEIRKYLGDDLKRIERDKERTKPKQWLFTKKRSRSKP